MGESPTARWEMTNGAPGSGLAGMVEAYCGYSEKSVRPVARREFAGASVVLVVGFGGAVDWQTRFALLDTVFARAAASGPCPDRHLVAAWSRLERRHGDLAISELVADTGWSRRRLAERFRAQVGLTPKSAARIMRFTRARDLLTRPGHRSLASIALSCGYYDQAQFNRDFQALGKCTPTEYLAAQLADVPGTGPGPND